VSEQWNEILGDTMVAAALTNREIACRSRLRSDVRHDFEAVDPSEPRSEGVA
jgi:hypothetical protein